MRPVPVGAKVHVQRGRPGYLQDPSRDMLHGLLHRLQMWKGWCTRGPILFLEPFEPRRENRSCTGRTGAADYQGVGRLEEGVLLNSRQLAVFFPQGSTPERKAGILGATMLVDFVFFEGRGGGE